MPWNLWMCHPFISFPVFLKHMALGRWLRPTDVGSQFTCVSSGHRFFTAKQYSSFNTLGRHFNVTRNDGSLLATTKLVNSQKSCGSFDPGRSPRVTDWVKRSSKSWSSMTTGWFGVPPWLRKTSKIYIYIYIYVSFPIYSKKLSCNVLKPNVINHQSSPSLVNPAISTGTCLAERRRAPQDCGFPGELSVEAPPESAGNIRLISLGTTIRRGFTIIMGYNY